MPLPGGGHLEVPLDEEGRPASPEIANAACAPLFRRAFHWDDEPVDLVDQDLATLPFRQGPGVPKWGVDAAPQQCAVDMMVPGVVAAEAAEIRCPVLIAQGARDLVPDPHAEPAAYAAATDITVLVQASMAHMHNFATTRRSLWKRIHGWGETVVGASPARRTESSVAALSQPVE
jgi:pimeloyl-ACP methyl ester carboxylesterase